jgi:hypothetical protein
MMILKILGGCTKNMWRHKKIAPVSKVFKVLQVWNGPGRRETSTTSKTSRTSLGQLERSKVSEVLDVLDVSEVSEVSEEV